MRVTAHVTAADGIRWGFAFPIFSDATRKAMFAERADGKYVYCDDVALRGFAEGGNGKYVTASGKDSAYLRSLVAHWVNLVNDWKTENCLSDDEAGIERTIRRIATRRRLEKVSYCRADWRSKADGVHVEISVDDNGVVERSPYEVMTALKLAEAAGVIEEGMRKAGRQPIILDRKCRALLNIIAWWRADAAEERMLAGCERRVNGYCTPADFGCKWFKCGQCMFVYYGDEARAIKAVEMYQEAAK